MHLENRLRRLEHATKSVDAEGRSYPPQILEGVSKEELAKRLAEKLSKWRDEHPEEVSRIEAMSEQELAQEVLAKVRRRTHYQ